MSEPITFRPRQSVSAKDFRKFPFEIRVLTHEMDRSEIFTLRYRAYLAASHIGEHPSGEYRDHHDDLASTVILAAYDADVCVGTLRVNFSQPWQPVATLPCASYYPDVTRLKHEMHGGLVEVSRLAIDPAITNTSYRTTLYASLVRASFMAAQAAEVAMILVATKSDWVRFYEYMLGFKQIGQPALYPPGDLAIALLGGSFDTAQRRQRAQNAFFKITVDEVASMRAAISTALAPPVTGHFKAVARF